LKTVLWVLLLCYLSSFILMVTSICTSSWYTTHPLAPRDQTSFGSVGLIEHCDKKKAVCMERVGILKFEVKAWPYRPLKNRDFDVSLLLLIIALVCTVSGLALTLVLCFEACHRKRWLKWLLLFISIKSAVLGISSVLYLDSKVKSEQFRHGWSSYVAWLSVVILIFVNLPALYLLHVKPVTHGNVKLNDYTTSRNDTTENEYILPHSKQFVYLDIHEPE